MKLIEDLGMQEYGTQGKKKRYGIYECPICFKQFKTDTASVLSGKATKCRSCATKPLAEAQAKVRINEAAKNFKEYCSILYNNFYVYDEAHYENAITKLVVTCRFHGNFLVTPNNHKRGRGCPACAKYGFNINKSAILYYLRITDSNTTTYKIGITNRTVQERFNSNDLAKITVLKTWDFPLGSDALVKEQEILKLYKEFKYIGDPLLSSGNTELFTYDVLGLDYASQGTSI